MTVLITYLQIIYFNYLDIQKNKDFQKWQQ